MPDREKVIEGLQKCAAIHQGFVCESCEYPGDDCAIDDAIAMLKAQEPRIVTEADFKNADDAGFIPAWCEEKDTGEVYCECILIGALEDAKFGHMRWWTSRPDDAAREATPWE